jgi:2'-5' RNA ligase
MSLYLTAIMPPAELAEQILEIKNELSDRFQIYAALKPPVHITLYRPLNIENDFESHLIKVLKPIGYNHAPFKVDLLNFDCFIIQTLFISVVKSSLLGDLQKEISSVFHKNKIDPKEHKGNTTFHPHITVAYRDIPPEVFPIIWDEYKNKKFRRSFLVDHFSLLKHDGKQWQIFREFPLQRIENPGLF